MTLHQFYTAALALLGETPQQAKGYDGVKLPLANQILAECYTLNNALLKSKGLVPLETIPTLTEEGDTIVYHEGLVRECMVYGYAALLVLDSDKATAAAFSAMYEQKQKKYAIGCSDQIANVY